MSNNVFEDAGIKLPALSEVDNMTEPLTAVALLTNPEGWRWFVVAGDVTGDGDVYCYGKVEGVFSEWGFFLLSDVLNNGGLLDLSYWETTIV